MNELYVPNAHIYFKTDKGSAEDAYNLLQEICFQNGIELSFTGQTILRDDDAEDIDFYED